MLMSGVYQIAVNTADLANGASIAAYLTSASGTLLTNTTIGAKEHLDVLDASSKLDGSAYAAASDYLSSIGVVDDNGNWVPLTLDANGALPVAATVNFAGDYAEDSAHVSGDIGLFSLSVRRDTRASGTSDDGDYASFNTNSVGELYVKDTDVATALTAANSSLDAIEASNAAIQASVANIDTDTSSIITELQAANTSLDAIESDAEAIRVELLDQGTTLDAILADTATIDSNVASLLAEVQALSFAEDSAANSGDMGIQALAVRKDANGSNAADGDYTSLQTWSDGSLKVVDVANGSILQQQVAVSSTAAAVPASALANRKSLMLQNTSAGRIWIGSATVTVSGATAGIELPANSFLELEVGPLVPVYAVKSGAGNLNLNVLEVA